MFKKILIIFLFIGIVSAEINYFAPDYWDLKLDASNITSGIISNDRLNLSFLNDSSINITNLWYNASNQDGRIISLEGKIISNYFVLSPEITTNISIMGGNLNVSGNVTIGQYQNLFLRGNLNPVEIYSNSSSIDFYSPLVRLSGTLSVENITGVSAINLFNAGDIDDYLTIQTTGNIPYISIANGNLMYINALPDYNPVDSVALFIVGTGDAGIRLYGNYSDNIAKYTTYWTDNGLASYLDSWNTNLWLRAINGSSQIRIDTGGNVTAPSVTNVEDLGGTALAWETVYAYSYVDVNSTDEELIKEIKQKTNKTGSELIKSVLGKNTESAEAINSLYPILFYICYNGDMVQYSYQCNNKGDFVCNKIEECNKDNFICDNIEECTFKNGVLGTGKINGALEGLIMEYLTDLENRIKNLEDKN